MTIVRLVNGADAAVKLSVEETLEALRVKPGDSGFIELPGEDGPIHLRPSGVIAVFTDARRSSAGFRMGVGATGG
ncbi:MAG: hypothetical protein WB802_06320 [Candidatus Dormiibacterota bacterium]|jgi:hypothetical protein